MTWMILKGVLLFLILSYAAYRDIKTRQIPDIIPIMLLITGFIGFSPLSSIPGLLVTVSPFLFAALKGGGMGGGDIKLMAACGFILGPWGGMLQTILGLALAVLLTFVRAATLGKKVERKTRIPLVPFLGTGGILSYLITLIGGSR